MKFSFIEKPTIPPLAWYACIDPIEDAVTVYHGSLVEVNENGFFEGAWNAPLEEGPFENATVVVGTGGWLKGDVIQLGGSTDRLSPIFSIRKKGVLHVSNSPMFVMEAAGEKPRDGHPFYNYDLVSVWRRGLYCPSGKLKLATATLRIHFATILNIDRTARISYSLYPLGEPPSDFESYHHLLKSSLQGLFENARSVSRRLAYQPLAGISRGYDSTASAVLSYQAGCREAFSFTDEKNPDPQADSGKLNAESLGMSCREYSRWTYLRMDGSREAEFCLTSVAVPKTMLALAGELKGRIIIGANGGDLIWQDYNNALINHMSVPWARYMSGLAQIEFRLREGYQVISAAMIGARHNQEIHQIDVSKEMDPWRVGGDYDRPIPRRIAEEAGLSRESFGTVKAGTGHAHFHKETSFSAVAWIDYQTYLKGRSWAAILGSRIKERQLNLWWKVVCQEKKIGVASTRLRRMFPFVFINYPKKVTYPFMFTFQWGFGKLRKDYSLNES